jgi:hypothetical protein
MRLTFEQYLGASLGEPMASSELTLNAKELLKRVNAVLAHAEAQGMGAPLSLITSAYRSPEWERKKGRSGRSSHCEAKAIDLSDPKQIVSQYLLADWARWGNKDCLLAKFGLYMEHPEATKGTVGPWLHLQTRPVGSGQRVFRP